MADLAQELTELEGPFGGCFARSGTRTQAMGYLKGLRSSVARKNSWELAEALGESTPYGNQHLLGRALWDVDLVRDDLQQYVAEHLGDDAAILVVDEKDFLKKCRQVADAARQHSGKLAGSRIVRLALLGLRHSSWAHVVGPGTVPAERVNGGSPALRAGQHS